MSTVSRTSSVWVIAVVIFFVHSYTMYVLIFPGWEKKRLSYREKRDSVMIALAVFYKLKFAFSSQMSSLYFFQKKYMTATQFMRKEV